MHDVKDTMVRINAYWKRNWANMCSLTLFEPLYKYNNAKKKITNSKKKYNKIERSFVVMPSKTLDRTHTPEQLLYHRAGHQSDSVNVTETFDGTAVFGLKHY